MITEGVLEAFGQHPGAAFALHVLSAHWPRGTFVSQGGPIMTASDALSVTVHGSGGRGSAASGA